jgi:uncharacterized membrane protein YkoI
MNQRIALMISAGLTVFVLMVAGGLALFLTAGNPNAATPAEAAPPAIQPTDVQAREDAYRQQIETANQRLQEADQREQELRAQLEAATAASAPAAPAFVDADTAAVAARNYLGGGQVVEVEFEQERGQDVYSVSFADGSEVYVDAASGQVVYAETRGYSEHDDDDHDDDEYEEEYEEHEDDD